MPNSHLCLLRRINPVRLAAAILILAGIAVRLYQFFYNRALWYDEAKLTLGILYRSFGELHLPMELGTTAPVLFMHLVKLSTVFFGYSEYGLRLVPLLFGIAAIFVYYHIAGRLLPRPFNVLSVAFLSFAFPLIYYATECKQYSMDVFIALFLNAFYVDLVQRDTLEQRGIYWLAVSGVLAILLSHPSLFVLAAMGSSLLLVHRKNLKPVETAKLVLTGIVWLTVFYLQYVLTLEHIHSIGWLKDFWSAGYLHLPRSMSAVAHDVALIENLLVFSGFPESGIILLAAVALFITGIFHVFQRHPRIAPFYLFFAAFLVTASAWTAYPIAGRMALFIIPFVFLLISAGVAQLSVLNKTLGICLFLAVIAAFLAGNIKRVAAPIEVQDFKTAMQHLRNEAEPGDVLYLGFRAAPSFFSHRAIAPHDYPQYIIGKLPQQGNLDQAAVSEIQRMKASRRIWLLLSGPGTDALITHMPGKQLAKFDLKGVDLYLFDFSGDRNGP